MVTEFPINKKVTIVCRYEDRRSGFRHVCEWREDGRTMESRSVSYINRTWESYNYESTIRALLEKMNFAPSAIKNIMARTAATAKGELDARFGSIAMVAQLGELMGGDTKKEKNDWKARMLKAGLGGSGLQMPEDWDTLSEDEKEKRLNRVIKELKR